MRLLETETIINVNVRDKIYLTFFVKLSALVLKGFQNRKQLIVMVEFLEYQV